MKEQYILDCTFQEVFLEFLMVSDTAYLFLSSTPVVLENKL